jgi:hypothetical protein
MTRTRVDRDENENVCALKLSAILSIFRRCQIFPTRILSLSETEKLREKARRNIFDSTFCARKFSLYRAVEVFRRKKGKTGSSQ